MSLFLQRIPDDCSQGYLAQNIDIHTQLKIFLEHCEIDLQNYKYKEVAFFVQQIQISWDNITDASAQELYVTLLKYQAFAYFQCNFYSRAVNTLYAVNRMVSDYETEVLLQLFIRSPILKKILDNIQMFDVKSTSNANDIARPESLSSSGDAQHMIMKQISDILKQTQNIIQAGNEILTVLSKEAVSSHFIVIVLSVLAIEFFSISNQAMTINVLEALLHREQNNPKHLAGIIQAFAQYGNLRGFESKMAQVKQLDLGYFRTNVFFGIEGLFLKNRRQFSPRYLEIAREAVPQLFLEGGSQNDFTQKQLKNAYPYYRNQLVEMMKVAAFKSHFANIVQFHPAQIYLDLYFD